MYRPGPRLPHTSVPSYVSQLSEREENARFKMNNTINYCVRRLINEVEARPTIWDSRSKEYSDRALKRGAWEELCASFVPNYYKSSDAEKKGIGRYLNVIFLHIRCTHLRHKSCWPSG